MKNQFDDAVNRWHLIAINNSPIFKPQVRGYLYQIAKTVRMELDRKLSANPLPCYPTQEMIDTQEHYCYVLGGLLQVSDSYTISLLDWAVDEVEKTHDTAEKLTEKLITHILE